ncbi:MAG: HAD family hydrolase [Nitrosomonadales bacterium]|jgi:phosphoglycolate phosphatase|nr:HAD family hydrolase [Nitrosomonadales bacterium]MBT3918077.1 HAD family hydrolase [Nitrosomonadales bacterium]MBT4183448.1 HAD family hydrolase [Nitrosomonadales bacterium]MBT4570705.1 HAD family hydrolase [Nitrosomonadales bacterium]MBT4759872.1 HAD family hydrolase [Nitrosomonadales bacterium]
MIKKVLFDLDGTFVDSAHDLVKSANDLYAQYNFPSITFKEGREVASDGIQAYLNLRFNKETDNFVSLSLEFINIYKGNILNNPILFDGISDLINLLDKKAVGWGIITNKHRCFVEMILKFIGLDQRCEILICGDDGIKPKPSPDMLISACKSLKVKSNEVVYVGDAHKDMCSSKSANIFSILACYGYLKNEDEIESWGADATINHPSEIVDLIKI